MLVVSHGAAIRIFLAHLGYAPLAALPQGAITNTGSVQLDSDGQTFAIRATSGVRLYSANE